MWPRVCVCVFLTLPHTPPPSLWIPLTYTRVCAQELLFELFSCQTARYFCDGPGPPACTQAPRTAASRHAGGNGATSPLSCPGDFRVLGSPCVFPRGSRFTWPWMEHAPCMGKRRVRVGYTCLFVYLSVCSIVCVCVCVCLCSVCVLTKSPPPLPPMWYCHCCSGSPCRRNNFGHIDELVRCAYGL